MDQFIDATMKPIANFVSAFIFASVPVFGTEVPLIVFWLVAGGVFFTGYSRFINVRGFAQAVRIVSGRYKDPDDPGEISQFQALTTAVSGTVGVGNIANVAVAISLGGPGATFWMIVAGLLGMSTKFAECTLGVRYRKDNPDGSVSGGPMYYLERGLADLHCPRLGKGLGIFYAGSIVIGCIGIGNMFQSNQATAIFLTVANIGFLSDNAWLVGVALAILVGVVIVGGIKSIANTTSKLVPAMALLYIAMALLVIGLNADRLPGALVAIWERRVLSRGHSGRRVRRAHPRVSARGVFQRSRAGQRGYRACDRTHAKAGKRGIRGLAGAVYRHRRDLHHDRVGHRDHRVRTRTRR